MHSVDKLAYATKLDKVSPSEKIIFSMLPLLVCLLSSWSLIHGIIFFIMTVYTVRYSALNLSKYLHFLLIPGTFIFLGLVTIIFNFSKEYVPALWCFSLFNFHIYVTKENLALALGIFTRSISSISCFYFLILNTPMNNLFSFLQEKKVSPLLVTLTELIYRFSFVLWGQLQRIRTAQMSRLGYLNFKNGIKSSGEILAMTFESSLIRVNNMDIVLQSRCFDGNFNIISDSDFEKNVLKKENIIINSVLFILLLVEVYFTWIY